MTDNERLKVFAHNLTTYMNQLGYTQKDIAEKLGVTQQAVNTWTTGKNSPRMDKAQKLAHILNVEISDLVEPHTTVEIRPELMKLLAAAEKCTESQVDLLIRIAEALKSPI